jgi:hypothetical protein
MSANPVTDINVPYPSTSDLNLRITVGACRLRIVPGDGQDWITGTYRDAGNALPLRVYQEGSTVHITQERNWADVFGWLSSVPALELAIGKQRPFALTLETGASENDVELGGVPVTRLVTKHGAGRINLSFSEPNPQQMSLFNLAAGAGDMNLRDLANANFAEMVVEGGAAAYRFHFGGTLKRNAHARIQAGVCSVQLAIPRTLSAKVTTESVIGGLAVGDGFTKREGAFWTGAAVSGGDPVLTVRVNVALGSLNLDMV